MKFTITGAAAIAVWLILTFGVAVPSGWVHLPLAVGVVLIAMGIVKGSERSVGGSGKLEDKGDG